MRPARTRAAHDIAQYVAPGEQLLILVDELRRLMQLDYPVRLVCRPADDIIPDDEAIRICVKHLVITEPSSVRRRAASHPSRARTHKLKATASASDDPRKDSERVPTTTRQAWWS